MVKITTSKLKKNLPSWLRIVLAGQRAGIMIITIVLFTSMIMVIASTMAYVNLVNVKQQNADNQRLDMKLFINACAEESIFRIKMETSPQYTGGTLAGTSQNCTIVVQGDNLQRTIDITATSNNYTKKLQITVDITTNDNDRSVAVASWQEI